MFKILPILFLSTFIFGCAPTIINRDFEKEEAEYIKANGIKAKTDPLYQKATPDVVVAGKEDNVVVVMYKDLPIKQQGVELQVWKASITNKNDYPVCVLVHWKLMDFEMVSDYADFTLLKPKQQLINYATMNQQIWNLDGTRFALPPSGYIDSMIVHDPVEKAKRGQECVFDTEVVEK